MATVRTAVNVAAVTASAGGKTASRSSATSPLMPLVSAQNNGDFKTNEKDAVGCPVAPHHALTSLG